MPLDTDVTRLLLAWSDGDPAAAAPLMDAVYRGAAHRATPSLARAARVLGLGDRARPRGVRETRQSTTRRVAEPGPVLRHCLAADAPRPRRSRPRARQADKRGAAVTVSLDDVRATAPDATPDVIALDRALERLATLDPRQARLVELRFFGGLTFDEAAVVLDVAAITLKRDWALARTWLYRRTRRTVMTSPHHWERVRGLFHAALDIPPNRRHAFVEPACWRSAGPRRGHVAARGLSGGGGVPEPAARCRRGRRGWRLRRSSAPRRPARRVRAARPPRRRRDGRGPSRARRTARARCCDQGSAVGRRQRRRRPRAAPSAKRARSRR